MNKMKCFSAALVAFFLSAAHLCAQDIEKEFDDFAKQSLTRQSRRCHR